MLTTILLWVFGLIYVAACIWMMLVVLLQEGKSGGMGASEGPASAPSALTESLGVGGAQKGLFNMTSYTAAVFFVVALLLTILGDRREMAGGSLDLGSAKEAAQTAPATTAPATPAAEVPANAPPAEDAKP